jgi:hypothetical protein
LPVEDAMNVGIIVLVLPGMIILEPLSMQRREREGSTRR